MQQVIKAVLRDPEDDTQLSLLYANQSPDDILLLDELQEMAKDPRFKVWYTGAALLLPIALGCSQRIQIPIADCMGVLCLF